MIKIETMTILETENLHLIEDFGDGMFSYSNPDRTMVCICSEFEEGEVFQVSGWTKHPTKSLKEIGRNLYGK